MSNGITGGDGKYRVTVERVDGKPKHVDCEYFVLDVTHDPVARDATQRYADIIRDDDPVLAADLDAMVRRLSS